MQKVLSVAAAAFICGLGSIASADLLYNETFSTDGPVADYVGTGEVFASGVGTVGMPGVSAGKLTFGFIKDIGGDNLGSVASGLGSEKALVSMKVDLVPTSYSDGGFRFVAGDTTDLPWVGWDPNGRSFANFYVNASGISIPTSPATVATFALGDTHTVSVFLNDSGSAQTYVGPDGGSYSLADQTWSVFDGNTALAQNVARGGASTLTYIGMMANRNWGGAQTLTDIDNLVIRDDLAMYPVPEPTSIAVLALGGMALLNRRRMQ